LGAAGEAFFIDQVQQPVDEDYSTSPLVSPSHAATGAEPDSQKSTLSEYRTASAPSSGAFSNRVSFVSPPFSAGQTVPPPQMTHEELNFQLDLYEETDENGQIDIEKPEWHDAYRLIADANTTLSASSRTSSYNERLSWGWGALPVVKSSVALDSVSFF
jgi:hypothetical protein